MVDSLISMCEALGLIPSLLTKRGTGSGVDGSPGFSVEGRTGDAFSVTAEWDLGGFLDWTKWAVYPNLVVPSCPSGCLISIPNTHLSSARFVWRAILQVGRRHAWSSSPIQPTSRYGTHAGLEEI